MKETIEHNNRFYGEELKTESEQYKEWLVIANKEIERLKKRNKEIYEGFMATTEELCEATKEIERLQDMDKILRNENINLKLRINKAIKYIESYLPNYDFDKTNLIKLLEILKGEE